MLQSANRVTFTINGDRHEVGVDVPPTTSLNTYIRDYCNLKGTKNMCLEGGCGTCVVSASTPRRQRFSFNSCLTLVHSCHGWNIETIEGIGNKKIGYHRLQARLAHYNGTQCGYCSPGMVMNMYSLTEGKSVTMQEVENSIGGNICRCTGYRPILDGFKSIASDAPPGLSVDIEDLYKVKICPKTKEKCIDSDEEDFVLVDKYGKELLQHPMSSTVSMCMATGVTWFKVTNISGILDIFKTRIDGAKYMLLAGNTAHGVYRESVPPDVYIDISDVAELTQYSVEPSLKLGGNMTLADTISLFNDLSKKNKKYAYLKGFADHISLVANVPVRNIGTIAGNLMIKHQHMEFPSDVFLLFETVGATINITSLADRKKLTFPQFIDCDMNKKIIESIELPPMADNDCIKTYKIMPRFENAHAYVNAGFKCTLNINENGRVLNTPSIVFGGINPYFIHAEKTENYLIDKNLFDKNVLAKALQSLDGELVPDYVLPDASPKYRRRLASGLFYKFVLSLGPPGLPGKLKSGGLDLKRPLSSGQQKFQTDERKWPLTKPMPKLEALQQTSGEAHYVNDMPAIPGELFAAFVIARVAGGSISSIDASEALKMPGVVRFLKAEDIPGKNGFLILDDLLFFEEEEILCSGEVKYAGQTCGLVVAKTRSLAEEAARKVKIELRDTPKKPILTIRDAIASGDKSRIKEVVPASSVDVKNAKHVIKGTFDAHHQCHFPMETLQTVCVPTDNGGLNVFSSSQYPTLVQSAISQSVNIKAHIIDVQVTRVGGGFGQKISRSSLVACGCAIAAVDTKRPVRLLMSMETSMEAIGMRYNSAFDYEVGVDDSGKIMYLKADVYEGAGAFYNEQYVSDGIKVLRESYDNGNWSVRGFYVKTDVPTTVFFRAPGACEAVAQIEHIMENIAQVLKKDAADIRLLNLNSKADALKTMFNDLRISADYDARKKIVDDFNKMNRWMKKGISIMAMNFPMLLLPRYCAMVCIYADDGTVAVAHGGIECGQGINTKVAQVVASELGIPLELVAVKPTNNFTAPNNFVTGGSITSNTSSYSAKRCCEILLQRLEPIKKTLSYPTWPRLVKEANNQAVDLCASHMYPYGDDIKTYNVFGVVVIEVELDTITGQCQVSRADILEDAGRSLNPEIDVGQVEGAFVMGLGYWLHEEVKHDPDTGINLTIRSWNYKPPVARDIPIDFRVELRKNAPNPLGFLQAKATGEPPLCLSSSAIFALRQAVASARKDAGLPDSFFPMKLPATPENLVLACEQDISKFVL